MLKNNRSSEWKSDVASALEVGGQFESLLTSGSNPRAHTRWYERRARAPGYFLAASTTAQQSSPPLPAARARLKSSFDAAATGSARPSLSPAATAKRRSF